MKILYGPAALAALALVSSSALAQPTETQRLAVSYADLDLNTPAGKAELMHRIRHAAEAVCGPSPDLHEVKAVTVYKRCMKDSLETAVAAIPAASKMAGSAKPAS